MRPGSAKASFVFAWLLLAAIAATAHAKPALLLYPGSFDPPHTGHVVELDQSLAHLRARFPDGAQAIVLPNHDRPAHVPGPYYVFDKGQRYRLAVASFDEVAGARVATPPGDEVSSLDQLLRAAAPYRATHEIYLLVGADAFKGLSKWPNADEVLSKFHVLVSGNRQELAALGRPARALGKLAAGYVAPRRGRVHAEPTTGREIEYVETDVPAVRSYPVFLELFQRHPIRFALRKPAVAMFHQRDLGAVVDLGHRLGDALGPGAALDLLEDDGLARQIAGVKSARSPRVREIADALARKAAERGRPVPSQTLARELRKLMRSPHYPTVRAGLARRSRP